MATAWEGDLTVQPARCPKHPQCSSERFYCVDCNRVGCAECRREALDSVNHRSHRTIPIESHLQQRRERVRAIKSDISKYADKHDRLLHEISFVFDEENKKQLKSGYDCIDDFARRLHQKVETLKSSLKTTFQQRAERKWASGTNSRRVADAEKAMETARTARSALEHEIRRAEMDELHLAEGSREMEALADRIAQFIHLDVELPAAADFDLRDVNELLNVSVAAFEAKVSENLEDLLAQVNEPRGFHLSNTGIVSLKLFKNQSDKYDPVIWGIVQPNVNSLLLLDGSNSSLKKLAILDGRIETVYSGPVDVQMGGLFAQTANRSVESLLSVEVERPKVGEAYETVRSTRVVLLLREASGRFALQNTLALPEKTRSLNVSFATLPNGNALCGVHQFTRLYELEPSATASSGAFSLKAHQLPVAYRCICCFRVNSEWRLAVSFEDNSVRAFTLSGGALSEVCRLPPFPAGVSPGWILVPRFGSLCVCSAKKNPDNSHSSYIDYVEFDPFGNFFTPSRLLEHNRTLCSIATLAFAETPHSRIALVACDFHTSAVQFYEFTK